MLVIAHLSDPHIDGSPAARERLVRVTAYLDALPRHVDVIVVTGDITDHGAEDELLPPGALVCPGNHDRRAPFRAGLKQYVDADGAVDDPVNQVHDLAGSRFVLVDSSVPGEDHGLLTGDTLRWLREQLTDLPSGLPVFVCFHHPPVDVGHSVIDGWRMRDEQGLADVLADSPGVTALLAGHIHSAATATFAGRPLLIAPGIRSTVPLPWEPVGGDHSLLDLTAPPGLAFHLYDDANGLRTHFRYLP